MTKLFAIGISLMLLLACMALSFVFLWGIAKSIAKARDQAHARSLRVEAGRLLEEGYGEAAEHFMAYAEQLEAHQKGTERKA